MLTTGQRYTVNFEAIDVDCMPVHMAETGIYIGSQCKQMGAPVYHHFQLDDGAILEVCDLDQYTIANV